MSCASCREAVTEADWKRGLRGKDVRRIEQCLDAALDAFGPQRLMFGSDWPVCLLAASYDEVASIIERWAESRLSAAERTALGAPPRALLRGADVSARSCALGRGFVGRMATGATVSMVAVASMLQPMPGAEPLE